MVRAVQVRHLPQRPHPAQPTSSAMASLEATWVALAADRGFATLATVAWLDTWAAFWKRAELWSAVSVDISVDILWKSAVFVHRRIGGVAAGTAERTIERRIRASRRW